MAGYLLFADFAVLCLIALTCLTRRVDRAGFGIRGWALLGLAAATLLSMALLVMEPWFRGPCGQSVFGLLSSSSDQGPEGQPAGCDGAQGQANVAFVIESVAIVAALVVFATSAGSRTRDGVSPGR